MARRNGLLACLVLLVTAGSIQADVVARKRSPGVTDASGLGSSIQSAIVGNTITVYGAAGEAADTFVYANTGYAQDLCYENSGAAPIVSQQYLVMLFKFGLDQLSGFAGASVNKTELRLYSPGGNSGLNDVGYITPSDWSEGNKAGPGLWGYPGD